jgi:hypothetical protein
MLELPNSGRVCRENESPGTTSEERLRAEALGALQVLHLGTCYSLRGYPGQRRTLHPWEPLVKPPLTGG